MELRTVPRERSDPWRLLAIATLKQAAHDGDAGFLQSQWAEGVAGLAELEDAEMDALTRKNGKQTTAVSADASRTHRIVTTLSKVRDEVEQTAKGSIIVSWAGDKVSIELRRTMEA